MMQDPPTNRRSDQTALFTICTNSCGFHIFVLLNFCFLRLVFSFLQDYNTSVEKKDKVSTFLFCNYKNDTNMKNGGSSWKKICRRVRWKPP